MQPSSDLFDAALRGAHGLAIRVRAHLGDGPKVTVPISAGSVTFDRTRPVRRTVELTVPGRDWISNNPTDPDRPITPYGGIITVERGIAYPDGTRELIPLGVFAIATAAIDQYTGETKINGEDLFSRLVDDTFATPRTPTTPAQTVRIITELIQETLPGVDVNVDDRVGPQRWAKGTVLEESRADAITEAAESLGCEIFADATGGFTIVPTPSLDDPPVATYTGGNQGILVSADTERTRDRVYNAVTAYSEPTDGNEQTYRATIIDDDPTSPTRWNGPFGHKPLKYESTLITNQAQARVVARAKLADTTGFARSISMNAVPDPRHEAGDVVLINDGIARELHILDTITIPLTAEGTWSASSRAANDTTDPESGTAEGNQP